MISRWYVPNSSGDFRLEADPDDPKRCVLTVEDPTSAEVEDLTRFLKVCMDGRRKWLPKGTEISFQGRDVLSIGTTVAKAGPHLCGQVAQARGVLHVVTSKDGKVLQTVDVETRRDADAAPAKLEEAASKPEARSAVTVKRGTVCCPVPVEGPLARSSRVLREFSSRRQWRQWVEHACMDVVGGVTGRLYRVFHRHHPAAIELGQCILDVASGLKLHRWDYSVPPAEEVLSAVLILRHREAWIRNPSGAYGLRFRGMKPTILPNPLTAGVGQDGRWDATVFSAFGQGFAIGRGLRGS